MLKSYLTIAGRTLRKHPAYTFINLAGLSIGMACCLLILLFVRDELSYDTYHEQADHIYRVTRSWFNEDGTTSLHLGHVAPPIGPLLEQEFPEVLNAVRTLGYSPALVGYEGTYFNEDRFFIAEEDIFDVFSMPLLRGNPETALAEPFTVVLSEAMAAKYFGAEDPIGKTLSVDNQFEVRVTGVMQNVPHNTHFHADFLASFASIESLFPEGAFTNWGSNNYATYLLVPAGFDPQALEARFPAFLDEHYEAEASKGTRLHLQRLTDIHLRSHLDSEIEPNGDIRYVYLFSAVALFILLIACINFMNLAAARSAGRAREVGMRKVLGAHRMQLIRQFLGESTLLSFIGLLIAVALVQLALPAFNSFTGKALQLVDSGLVPTLAGLVAITLLVGIVAGSYPALVLSAFRPAHVLKNVRSGGIRGVTFRRVLVVAQFAISIILLICMGVVFHQLEYVQNKRLGFDKSRLVVLPMSTEMRSNFESVREQLLAHPHVEAVTASKRVPSGRLLDSMGATAEVDGESLPVNFRVAFVSVDHDFIDAYGMELAAGRNFSKDLASDSTEAFLLNEEAVRQIGWASPEEAIGKTFLYGDRRGQVIGVMEDFHFESLHQPIAPLVLFINPNNYFNLTVKMAGSDIPGTLAFLEAKWQQFRPNYPFTYRFIDENFARLYDAEQRLAQIFGFFAGLAILIACLGLFGLAAFTAEQRTKEIGVRKVLGASISSIVLLLSKEFSRLVLIAFAVSVPLAYLGMSRWLDGFAYHTRMPLTLFLLAGLTALTIALATVSYQSVKAALADPVKALRYE